MAQMNWSSYDGNVGGRNQRPMRNTRQTEGERLHDQALSFYAHGNVAQAEFLLNKAIALEPLNGLFRETRSSLSRSVPSHSHSHQHVPPTCQQHVGSRLPGAESHRRQFIGKAASSAAHSPRATWDGRQAERGARLANVFPSPGPRVPWLPLANGTTAQYFSNTVADSMFGPGYQASPEAVQNFSPQDGSHFDDVRSIQRPNSYPVRSDLECQPMAGSSDRSSSRQDNIWGEWTDSEVNNAAACEETSWVDSGYQQSDVPWTEETRRAVSLPNCSRSSATCSASQGSFRGSMANSAKDQQNRAGRSSEETCSETGYAADNFEDVSNKVEEWLVKNQSTGVLPPPPGFAKIKKKKKKKKMVAPKDCEGSASVARKPATPFSSDLLSQSNDCTLINNPSQSHAASKPFFDPKKIFPPSNGSRDFQSTTAVDQESHSSARGQNLARRPDHTESGSSKHLPPPSKNTFKSQTGKAYGSQSDRTNPNRYFGDPSPQRPLEADLDNVSVRKRESSGSCESNSSGQMTREEWAEIINKMYVPLGYPPSGSPDHPETSQSIYSAGTANKSFEGGSTAIHKDSPGPSPKASSNRSPGNADEMLSKAGSRHQDKSQSRRNQYVDIKATLQGGAFETIPPVCHAGTTVMSTGPAVSRSDVGLGRGGPHTTAPTQTARPACQSSPAAATVKDGGPSKAGNTLPGAKPLAEPKVEASPAPVKVTGQGRHVGATSDELRSQTESDQEVPAKAPSAKTAKAFWEPARIFGGASNDPKSKPAQADVNRSKANATTACSVPPGPPSTGLKKDNSGKTEITKTVRNGSTEGGQELKKSVAETAAIHCSQKTTAPVRDCKPSCDEAGSCSYNSGLGQTKAVPSSLSTNYSYVAWKKQNTTKDRDSQSEKTTDSTLPSPPGSFPGAEYGSRLTPSAGNAAGSQPGSPAANPTVAGKPQSSEKDPVAMSGTGLQNSTAQAQEGSDCKSVPDKSKMPGRECGKTKDASSTKKSQHKPEADARDTPKPYSEAFKTKPSSAPSPDGQPFQHKREKTSTAKASHTEWPSAHSSSKGPSPGASSGPRSQSATSSSAKTPSSGASASSKTREDNVGPRQRTRKQETFSGSRTAQDELDLEDVDPWYKWMRAIGGGLWWALCFAVFLLLILIAFLYSTIKVGAKYFWHVMKELMKLIQEHRRGDGFPQEGASQGQGSWGSSSQGPGAGGGRRSPVDIPTSGDAAIKRLLLCNRDNPYEVLGVSSEASAEDMKKCYRKQCMLVHPDKNDLPNAQEAFQILQRAYDTLTDPTKKRDFDRESRHAHFGEEMEEIRRKMEEALNTLSCDVCLGKHRRYETDRTPDCARYCRQHDTRHPAYEGDVWVETTHLGFKWHYYAMMEDRIFDITQWAACQDMKHMEANSCEVRYHVGTRGSRNASRQRSQPPGAHSHPNHHTPRSQDYSADMTEELLKEFLRQFQQGEARGGVPRGGYGGGDANAANQERGRRNKKHRKKKR